MMGFRAGAGGGGGPIRARALPRTTRAARAVADKGVAARRPLGARARRAARAVCSAWRGGRWCVSLRARRDTGLPVDHEQPG